MDNLRSTYKDDDDEWADALDRTPSPRSDATDNPPPVPSPMPPPPPLAALLASPPPPPPPSADAVSGAEELHQVLENGHGHGHGNGHGHGHGPSPSSAPPDRLTPSAAALASDDDDDESSARKKQKPLSSFTTPSAAAAAAKKSKKKSNNVWTKSSSRKGKKKSKSAAQGPAAAPAQDTVVITPIPRFPDKSDDSPDATICLSRVYKAEKVELSDDRLTAGSTKGYRMVRATRGVADGAWYFEIRVVRLGDTGHTRLGWTTDKGDLQAPVGYDGNSFGYRDIDGSKIHKALREKYGLEGYAEGDVIGFYINLPDGASYAPKPPHLVWYKGQRYMYSADGKDEAPKIVPGSEISFFKNGVCQGAAFKDLFGGRYYPAASMYTLPNQPNCEVRFNFGPDFEFFPQDFGGRPTPQPMIEVPYHGYDSRVEAPTENGDTEKTS